MGGGHRAAAEALHIAAEEAGARVSCLDAFAFAPQAFSEVYRALHFAGQGIAPQLYGRAYFGANRRSAFEPLRGEVDLALFRPLIEHLKRVRPDVVVATHHLALVAVARAKERGELDCRLACVVTDYTAHAVWAVRSVDQYFVANEMVADELTSHGVPSTDITCTGIPVKAAFSRIAPLPRSHATSASPVEVLLTSGGFGIGPIDAILRGFADLPDLALTVVCGSSASLEARARSRVRELGLRARVLGFVSDMPSLMDRAHVVVGKAGGLTVTETLTAGRPLVIVGAVPGNEQLNETWVTMGGAGVSSTPALAGATVLSLRDQLAAMGAKGRTMVASDAAQQIVGGLLGSGQLRIAA